MKTPTKQLEATKVTTPFGRLDTSNPDVLDKESLATIGRGLEWTAAHWDEVTLAAGKNPAKRRLAQHMAARHE